MSERKGRGNSALIVPLESTIKPGIGTEVVIGVQAEDADTALEAARDFSEAVGAEFMGEVRDGRGRSFAVPDVTHLRWKTKPPEDPRSN